MNILFDAIDMIDKYEKWLKNRGINLDYIINKSSDSERRILLTAFTRVNKNWNLTKKQKQLIKKLKEK